MIEPNSQNPAPSLSNTPVSTPSNTPFQSGSSIPSAPMATNFIASAPPPPEVLPKRKINYTLIITLIVVLLAGGYLFYAQNKHLFPFKAKEAAQEQQKKDKDGNTIPKIDKAARLSNAVIVQQKGGDETFSAALPDGFAVKTDIGTIGKIFTDAVPPVLIVNKEYDKNDLVKTWDYKLLYLDYYGINRSGDALLRRDSMMETMKLFDTQEGTSGWQYSAAHVAGYSGFKREKELIYNNTPYYSVEYYILTNNNIFMAVQNVWKETANSAYKYDEISEMLATLEIR